LLRDIDRVPELTHVGSFRQQELFPESVVAPPGPWSTGARAGV
jgi:hypothetical protein